MPHNPSVPLRQYLDLEKLVKELDAESEEDLVGINRDLMHILWSQRLTVEDQNYLNSRGAL